MAQQPVHPDRLEIGDAPVGRWISRMPVIERPIFVLRWLSLLLAVILHWFDESTAGVLLPVSKMVMIAAAYNAVLLLLMHYLPWLRRPLNYLALDTVATTLAVYLTGGYHSSFFVLYIFVMIVAAFHLELAPTIAVTLITGLIYIGACYVNPGGLRSPYALYILAAKLLALLVAAVLCALLLEQLRREHRETEREREQVARLRALEQMQAGFVSAVSHELRTPLTCIKTSVDLLQASGEDQRSESQLDLIQTIKHHVSRLESLVTDLLEITKLEAGQLTLSKQPTDLRRIVGRVAEALRPLTDRKSQTVHLDWPAALSPVEVDRQRIEQVLTNILTNAHKFTPKGGQIRLQVTEKRIACRSASPTMGRGSPPRIESAYLKSSTWSPMNAGSQAWAWGCFGGRWSSCTEGASG